MRCCRTSTANDALQSMHAIHRRLNASQVYNDERRELKPSVLPVFRITMWSRLPLVASVAALFGAAAALQPPEAARFGEVTISPSTVKPGEVILVINLQPCLYFLIVRFNRHSPCITTLRWLSGSPSTTMPIFKEHTRMASFSQSCYSLVMNMVLTQRTTTSRPL